MTYFDRMMSPTMKRLVVKTTREEASKERVYKDDDLVMDTLGTRSRLTAAQKRANDEFADRLRRFRI